MIKVVVYRRQVAGPSQRLGVVEVDTPLNRDDMKSVVSKYVLRSFPGTVESINVLHQNDCDVVVTLAPQTKSLRDGRAGKPVTRGGKPIR